MVARGHGDDARRSPRDLANLARETASLRVIVWPYGFVASRHLSASGFAHACRRRGPDRIRLGHSLPADDPHSGDKRRVPALWDRSELRIRLTSAVANHRHRRRVSSHRAADRLDSRLHGHAFLAALEAVVWGRQAIRLCLCLVAADGVAFGCDGGCARSPRPCQGAGLDRIYRRWRRMAKCGSIFGIVDNPPERDRRLCGDACNDNGRAVAAPGMGEARSGNFSAV